MLGVGVYFSVNMHLIMNPPDGAVHELSAALKKDFGKMKIIVDVGMVILSSIVSLLFLNKIIGIGIGTVVI
ncbi:MAG: hypothetical protein GX675_00040 [Erysipelotrichaceae bacterium]|nr:hypothetical protein [Erysipelotrichaceae bacterium]